MPPTLIARADEVIECTRGRQVARVKLSPVRSTRPHHLLRSHQTANSLAETKTSRRLSSSRALAWAVGPCAALSVADLRRERGTTQESDISSSIRAVAESGDAAVGKERPASASRRIECQHRLAYGLTTLSRNGPECAAPVTVT